MVTNKMKYLRTKHGNKNLQNKLLYSLRAFSFKKIKILIYLIYNGNLNIYRFANPYLKPVESTLVRHVQSSQDHTKLDEGIF